MRYLILINGAPYHRPFFRRVGEALVARGHEVHYAVDSHYTDFLYPDEPLPEEHTSYFSEFFERNADAPPAIPAALEGRPLWSALYSDLDRAFAMPTAYRTKPGYYDALAACLVGFFWELWERHQFDCVVYEPVSNAFAHVAYRVARARNAQFLGFMASRIPGRTDVLDAEFMTYSKTKGYFDELRTGKRPFDPELRAFVDDYLANFTHKVPDYMVQLEYLLRNPIATYAARDRALTLTRSLAYLAEERSRHRYSFQLGNPAVIFPVALTREFVRYGKVRWLRATRYERAVPGEKYFLYPMQFHPESSTSINAAHFNDELTNVRSIAISMPFGMKLYVKDHPHAAGRERLRVYRDIARFPNVRLIDPGVSGTELVRGAQAVVTCTSTMGYEGIMFGVPVFTLGETVWDFYPGNVKLHSMKDAAAAFSRYRDVSATQRDREAFVGAYYLSTIEGIYDLKRTFADHSFVERTAAFLESEMRSRTAT